MEEMPVRDRIECLEQIYRDQVTQIFPMECVVPDAMPDVDSILMSDGEVYIRSGSLSAGCATLEGSIMGTVICIGTEESEPYRLELNIPATITFQSAEIREEDRLTFSAALTGAEARIVNSRKIAFRAEVNAGVRVWRQGELTLSADTEGVEQAEILSGEMELGYIMAMGEKTFTVADDVDLPTPIEKLLWHHVRIFTENAKKVGGKTILQGGAELQLLYLPPESDVICSESFRIPFSQIMDAPEGETSVIAVGFRTIACFTEILPGLNRSETVSIELQLAAQVLYTGERHAQYTADMYSLISPLKVQAERKELEEPYASSSGKALVKELIELPERAAEVICVNIRMSPCQLTDAGIRTMAGVGILYRTESGLRSAARKISVEFADELKGASVLSCSAVCEDVFTSVQNDGILLQFDAELTAVKAKTQTVTYISSARQCEQQETDRTERPSIVAVRPGNRSLWELAKTYRSTVKLIEAANPGERCSDSLLLIPRGR